MFNKISPKDRLIIALDVSTIKEATYLIEQTKSYSNTYKIGLQLYLAVGNAIFAALQKYNINIFLDLKLHDIPNTVLQSVKQVLKHNVSFLTIHALGGPSMLKAASEAYIVFPKNKTTNLLAVSVLTHHTDREFNSMGFTSSIKQTALDLLIQAKKSGINGCVCSPKEAQAIKNILGNDFLTVCPGIRPTGSSSNEQARTDTPIQAIKNGADYLVIGRPITSSTNPELAAKSIHSSIASICT